MVEVRLADYEVEERWQGNEDQPFGDDSNIPWFVDMTLYLEELRRNWFKRLWFGNSAVECGHIGLLVCSEAYVANPRKVHRELIQSAHVAKYYDEASVIATIEEKLENVHAKNDRELCKILQTFLYVN